MKNIILLSNVGHKTHSFLCYFYANLHLCMFQFQRPCLDRKHLLSNAIIMLINFVTKKMDGDYKI